MSGHSLTQEALNGAIMLAREQGFEVVIADSRTILLDIDTAAALNQYDRVMPVVREHFPIRSVVEWLSKSGGLHARIVLADELAAPARYALQAMLSSDGIRETLILIQHLNGCDEPSVLFKPATQPACKPWLNFDARYIAPSADLTEAA